MTEGKILKIDGVSYTLGRQLGQGGTAQVFEARSSEDDKVYALKRIRKDARSSRNERFRNEIAFGIAAKNDHVVKIHAKFENEDYFYYIMDLYSKNLRGVMMEESDYEVLLDYLSQLCDGLAYIHREGIVHRDIKPENILIDVDNRRLVLADFGIAHFKDSFLTKPGEVLANRNYQAPEQMSKGEAVSVGQPADIFALGLIFTEVFTKQNPRGARHRRVGDVHPFLSNIDLLVERMTYQDETQRLKIQAVRESLNLLRQQISYTMDEIVEDLRHADVPTGGFNFQTDQILKQAGTDVLSAKYIFERATAEELALYNPHYHCEISYRVSPELYNICVHSKLYSMCKAKFEYEAKGTETELDLNLIVSPRKADLLSQFQSVQRQYPLSQHTIWAGLPPLAAHYFRFSKDYHCEELLESIHRVLSTSPYSHNETLHRNLVNAPIIWIASSVRNYLNTGFLDMSPHHLQEIEFETHLRIHWEGSTPDNSSRKTLGAELFDESADAELITRALGKFQNKWNASFLKQSDGRYSIYFRLRDEYVQFSKEALSFAAPNYEFEGDVLDLLRIDEEYDDVIALTWDSYDICSTLAKVLGLREI